MQLRAYEDVVVVVVSEGLGADWLQAQKAELGLENLRILPFQPHDRFSEVLGTATVLFGMLDPTAGVYSVPSKVLSYLKSGRAIVLAVPPENLAARMVQRAGAGLIVSPSDRAGVMAHCSA